MKLTDLREAKYNPRVISDKRLANLGKSMETYGDLSGIVFNKRTKTLVSGHQRLKTLRQAGIKTEIKTSKIKDNYGTVEEGHVIAVTKSGSFRIPLRVVDWSDKKSEMAANIAANAHGGDFDREKLGVMLAQLEKGKVFDIDVLGLDPLSIRGLMPQLPNVGEGGSGGEGGESFPEFGEDSFEFEHTCPKCKFQFNTSAASKSGGAPKPNKRVEATKATLAKKKKLKAAEDKSVKVKKKAKAEEAPVKTKKKIKSADKIKVKKKTKSK